MAGLFFVGKDIFLKLGIIGLPASGKTTLFRALTGGLTSPEKRMDPGVGVVKVKDPRVEFLSNYYNPKKVTPVTVEYMDIGGLTGESKPGASVNDKILNFIRPMDALVHCVRYFDSLVMNEPDPVRDFKALEEEMILSDLSIVERRLERIEKDFKRGKKDLSEEIDLLKQAHHLLNDGKPIRLLAEKAEMEILRGFSFLSLKPELVLINAGDEKSVAEITEMMQKVKELLIGQSNIMVDWLYADAEAEIASLSEEDAAEFLNDLNLEQGAKDRIIKKSFELLHQIVFITAGEPEVRAWQLTRGKTALKAAGTVHSDMERGFIRAEVIAYNDFREAGSVAAAQKKGRYRLEGRDYQVQDGDIMLFRFNV
jgi:GTP-binding protein YchF